MKKLSMSLSLLLGPILLLLAYGCGPDKNTPEAILKNVDATQAMAIANDWKWSKNDIKSYVTTQEVVFELSEKKVKKIPLPENKMLVAIAPYINQTHR
jgi:hypothetical protein